MASVKIIPNSYTNTGSYNFTVSTSNNTYKISNAYTDADSTTYARLTLASSRNSARTSTMYLEFDKTAVENIPSGATINSVTANVRYAVNNTTYVTAVSLQLAANTTLKGAAETTRSTTSSTSGGTKYSITPGSWTLNELKNVRLYISATHNTSTSSGYLYLYGADVTINYTSDQPVTTTPFRVKQNGSWVTPTKILVKNNGSWVEGTKILAKSNGTWH